VSLTVDSFVGDRKFVLQIMKQSNISRFFSKGKSKLEKSVEDNEIVPPPANQAKRARMEVAAASSQQCISAPHAVDEGDSAASVTRHRGNSLAYREFSAARHAEVASCIRNVFDSSAAIKSNVTGNEKVSLTPLEKQVVDLKKTRGDCLLMVECGYRIRFFGDDALVAAKILSIYAHKSHSFMVASIPTFRVVVHARRLIAAGHKVVVALID
jgi:hypothetical protein